MRTWPLTYSTIPPLSSCSRSAGQAPWVQPSSLPRAKSTQPPPASPGDPRTPEHLDGLPDLSPHDLKKVQDSKAIHSRGKDLFEAVAPWQHGVVGAMPCSLGCGEVLDLCQYIEDVRFIASSHGHRHQSIRGTSAEYKPWAQFSLQNSPVWGRRPCLCKSLPASSHLSPNLCLELPCVMAPAVTARQIKIFPNP